MKKGFTILELLVASIVVVIAIAIVLNMLHDQNSNLIGIRQRVQAQTSARDGLKIIESELRVAGFSPSMTPAPSRMDSITFYSGTCTAMKDAATGSSVLASDGSNASTVQNDTIYVAYPMAVSPSTGADCSLAQWSRYHVNGSGCLIRTTATSKAGLSSSTDTTVVARDVDVFQVRMGLTGLASPGATVLTEANACCAAATWMVANATAPISGGLMTIKPSLGSSWRVVSPTSFSTRKGERIRDTFSIVPDAHFFTDITNGATLNAGIYDASGNAVAVKPILTIPAAAKSLCGLNGKLTFAIDLVDPTGGSRWIGFSGTSKTVQGTLQVDTLNAFVTGLGTGASFKDPSGMATTDWASTKSVEVIILSRADSHDAAKLSKFDGLANYNTSGTFSVTDAKSRVRFDHVYPVGNNGGF